MIIAAACVNQFFSPLAGVGLKIHDRFIVGYERAMNA